MTVKRVMYVAAAVALCAALVGCSWQIASPSSEPTPAPTQSPSPTPTPSASPSPTPSPTPTPSPSPACTAALVLTQVRQLLAGQDFEAHYLTIGDRLTLSVWMVDLEIDPATPKSRVAAAGRLAVQRGLSVSYEIVDRIPCVREIFDQVNPMIVDTRFQHWYKDFLPVGAFEGLHEPTTDELIAAVKATGTAPEEPRATAPQAAHTPAARSCTWPAARAAIHAYLGTQDNTAVYVIIGAGSVEQPGLTAGKPEDVGIEVQWPLSAVADSADSVVRERLGHVVGALVCYRPVDWLEAFVVDPSGRTLVYAVVPGSTIQAGGVPLPPGGVRICHLSGPVCMHGSPGSEGLPAGS